MTDNEPDNLFFTAQTPLNCSIRVTVAYWNLITQIKHPIMSGQEATVQTTLTQPDEIRRSRSDSNVYSDLAAFSISPIGQRFEDNIKPSLSGNLGTVADGFEQLKPDNRGEQHL